MTKKTGASDLIEEVNSDDIASDISSIATEVTSPTVLDETIDSAASITSTADDDSADVSISNLPRGRKLIFRVTVVVTGAPTGGTIRLAAKKGSDYYTIPGSSITLPTSAGTYYYQVEIGYSGASVAVRREARNLAGVDASNYYTITTSIEGMID